MPAKNNVVMSTVFGSMIVVAPVPALACACCAESAQREQTTEVIDDYTRDILSKVQFQNRATLYSGAGEWEDYAKGINNPAQSYDYTLQVRNKGKSWSFSFQDDKGNSGALTVSAQKRLRRFSVDTQMQKRANSNHTPVTLYKEWELFGPVTGSGIFAASRSKGKAATAKLILQGSGNNCSDEATFKKWTLVVSGGGAKFRFFGWLR
jgi:hypothetical protein